MRIERLVKTDSILGAILIVLLRPVSFILGTFMRRNHDLVIRKHLAVMKIKGGGSLLIALPALLSLRKKYPDKKFTLVTSAEVRPFAELMGVFDEILIVDTANVISFFFSTINALRKVWLADGLINFEIHSKLTSVFSTLSCARNRFGFYHDMNSWQRDVITHLFFYNINSPVYINYNQVALALGTEIISYKEVSDFFVSHNQLGAGDLQHGADKNIVLAPFCSDLGREREFLPEHWVKILQTKFSGQTISVIILGGPGDISRGKVLEMTLKEALQGFNIVNLVGKTSLPQSARIIKAANEFLTIDSGLNHIARLTGGVQITSYWGPTDPVTRLAPFPDLNEIIVYKKLFCSPCVHAVSFPPCKGNNICMKQYANDGLDQYSTGGWIVISNRATPKSI